jgi:hypothetical protein
MMLKGECRLSGNVFLLGVSGGVAGSTEVDLAMALSVTMVKSRGEVQSYLEPQAGRLQ